MKKIICMILVLSMSMAMLGVSYASESSENNIIRQPESFSINRIDTESRSSIDYIEVEGNSAVMPMIFLGYEYIPGTAYLGSRSYDRTYSYIYGTSVAYSQGASPNYTLTVNRSTTKSSSWNVGGSVEFPIKVVEAEIKGGYSSSNSASISRGETWSCGFTEPGTYDLSWYMRGHVYPVYGNAKILSTGSDHGNITTVYLGQVTFPTKEVHFDVSRVK